MEAKKRINFPLLPVVWESPMRLNRGIAVTILGRHLRGTLPPGGLCDASGPGPFGAAFSPSQAGRPRKGGRRIKIFVAMGNFPLQYLPPLGVPLVDNRVRSFWTGQEYPVLSPGQLPSRFLEYARCITFASISFISLAFRMAWVRLFTFSLLKILLTWVLTVVMAMRPL